MTVAAFAENEADLSYVLSWSGDSGTTWISMLDNTSAITPGTFPSNPLLVRADITTGGNETFTWSTPVATFPRGSYLIRVEAYRRTNALHYAYHQEKIYIDR